MKNLLAIAFIGTLILSSCSKKETETESNIMLQEPKVETMDSTATAKPADGNVVVTDSTMIKVDSAK